MIKNRYGGEADQAARLQSARLQAGFTSARAAAVRFGLPLSRLRGQESGALSISPEEFGYYGAAFGVDPDWLRNGTPAATTTASAPPAPADVPLASSIEFSPAGRLRLARRLAGFRSVQAAAQAHGWTRSRLSAHEIGQNRLLPQQAVEYGRAFGVAPEWLMTGRGPSGYPPDIETELPRLLGLYGLPDGQARPQLPPIANKPPPPAPPRAGPLMPRHGGEPRRLDVVLLDEFDEPSLLAACAAETSARKPPIRRQWGVPPDFLHDVLNATDPGDCFVLVVGRPHPHLGLGPGDRIVIASNPRWPSRLLQRTVYAACDSGRIVLVQPEEVDELQSSQVILIGWVIGQFGQPGWMRSRDRH